MKLPFILLPILAAGVGSACAQETSTKIDAAAAKATLSGAIAKTPPKFITKGGGDKPTRFYEKGALIVSHASGAREVHPFVAVPLLFEKNSDELRSDENSRENVIKMAEVLKDLASSGASFAIEGHASAEGDPVHNRELSRLRALKIQALLRAQGVADEELVRVEGFGSQYAQAAKEAPEPEREQDRRVLVVKEK